MKPKIVVFVEGGVVTGVQADHQCEVIVLDADEEKEHGVKALQIQAKYTRLTKGLIPVY